MPACTRRRHPGRRSTWWRPWRSPPTRRPPCEGGGRGGRGRDIRIPGTGHRRYVRNSSTQAGTAVRERPGGVFEFDRLRGRATEAVARATRRSAFSDRRRRKRHPEQERSTSPASPTRCPARSPPAAARSLEFPRRQDPAGGGGIGCTRDAKRLRRGCAAHGCGSVGGFLADNDVITLFMTAALRTTSPYPHRRHPSFRPPTRRRCWRRSCVPGWMW